MIAVLIFFISSCFGPSTKSPSEDGRFLDTKASDTLVESIIADSDLQAASSDSGVASPKVLTTESSEPKKMEAKTQVEKEAPSESQTDAQDDRVADTTDQVEKEKNAVEEVTPEETEDEMQEADHALWDDLLRGHVSGSGEVDYKGLKSKEGRLDQYLNLLSTNVPDNGSSKAEAMAYWINAYNAFTVKLILKNYPVSSIMNLHGGKAWDVKWIELDGRKYSLNQIEHEILRKKYPDPRIHFAVNCAAASCPPLMDHAWTAQNLEGALERQTTDFINDNRFNQLEEGKVHLSKIFEWYKGDFGDLLAFVRSYSRQSIGENARVKFNEYDWKLNGK
jgi:hypothetical protein